MSGIVDRLLRRVREKLPRSAVLGAQRVLRHKRLLWISRGLTRYHESTAEVCLLSYPKSGRTWLRAMIGRVLVEHFQLDVELAEMFNLMRLADHDARVPKIVVSHDDNPQVKPVRRLERSKSRYRNGKVILLVRDPRDVIVSRFFQRWRKKDVDVETELPAWLFAEPSPFHSLLAWYNIWSEQRGVPRDFLLVRYEDLQADCIAELRRVIDFIGLTGVADEQLAAAVEFGKFDNLRQIEEQQVVPELTPAQPGQSRTYKTRRGKVGGYVDYFTPEQLAQLNQWMAEELRADFGYRPMVGKPAGS